ncbi:uncharacterized protein LOC134928726 [Pseudophryne corroboree]|uniref:uncharacterized protein LOC134928726 n=1 Tax=Pseudophryne corroboree TaxID=495146 RepID=UPI003081E381
MCCVISCRMQIFLLVTLVAGMLRQSQCCNPNLQGINLARDGQVVQSSLFNYHIKGNPENAIDGNRDGDFSRGSCTHNNAEDNPWWRLEFRKVYKIGTIIVANRQECCADRIVGAEVRVGNSLDNNNPVCGVITDADHITTLCCNGMEGRYVSVVIPGVQRVLHVCEVEVYEQDQESNYVLTEDLQLLICPTPNEEVFQQIGEMSGRFLEKGYKQEELLSSKLRLESDNDFQPGHVTVNAVNVDVNATVPVNLDPCSSTAKIELVGTPKMAEQIVLQATDSEMQIFLLVTVVAGVLRQSQCCNPNPQGINLARDGQVTQSSVYQESVKSYATNAIDGIRDGAFMKGSCTHTNGEDNPWWRLELSKIYKSLSIIVANREDCCGERLLGAEVRVGNSPDNNNPVCGVISGTGHITTLCCYGMEGRYISIVIPGAQKYLTLCEVEVYELDQEPNYVCW